LKPTFGNKLTNIDYQIRKGAYAIIFNTASNRVLTVKNKGYHFLPGGGIESNESDKHCIERELLEETGFHVEVGSFVGSALFYFFFSSKNEPILSDGYFYFTRIVEKVQKPTEEDHQVVWIDVMEVEKLFFYQHQVWAVREGLNCVI
jgi:8-oxo-dGTP diphosphatase